MGTIGGCIESGKTSRHERWSRPEYAEKIKVFEGLIAGGCSLRKIAKEIDVPRSTLRAWKEHRDTHDSTPSFIDFFESCHGLAFLHRLTASLHLVFVEAWACGVAMISKFMKLSGLNRFIASSEETQQKLNVKIEVVIVNYGVSETARLGAAMPAKDITVCQDETFTGGLCLVSIEPESGFIILEKKADDRTSSCEGSAFVRTPGRLIDYAQHIERATQNLTAAEDERDRLRAVQEAFRADVKGLSESYHLVDLERGWRLSPGHMTARLQEKIDHIRALAEQEGLSESSLARISKAERVLPKMEQALAFVSSHIRTELDKLGLSASLVTAIHTKLLPAAYLERIGQKKNNRRFPQNVDLMSIDPLATVKYSLQFLSAA